MSVVKYGAIESLKDVSITNLAVGDYLRYEKDGYWKNVTASVEGGTGSWTEDKLTTFVVKLINSEGGTKFVSKVNDDTVNGSITFKSATTFEADTTVKDVYYGNFTSGLTGVGGKIDSHGDAELNSLTLRESLTVPTLNYNRITVTSGETWQTVCCGEIESVDGNLATIKLEDGESSGITYNDICRAIYHNADGNADTTVDDCGFEQLQGFDTVYFKVTEVLDSGKQFKFELKPGSTPPLRAHMKFVVYGNFTDSDRQDSAYQTKQYTRFLKGVNDWAITSANVASQFGKLDGLIIDGAPNEGKLTGNGAYINNAYITGSIIELSDAQKAELQGYSLVYRDRGLFDINSTYYYDKATNVPDYEQDDATPIAKDNILIRDYVYDENGNVYTVKSYSTSNTGKALTEDCWQISTALGLVSINTLLAKSGKLGAFTFDDNTFASTNGKLSMNSETGKLVATEAEIKNSTLENVVVSQKRMILQDDMSLYIELNSDGTTYSLYNDTSVHDSGTLVSDHMIILSPSESKEIWVQPEHCCNYVLNYTSSKFVYFRLPSDFEKYLSTKISITVNNASTYGPIVHVITGDAEFSTSGSFGGANHIALNCSKTPTGTATPFFEFLATSAGWEMVTARKGDCNEREPLHINFYLSDDSVQFSYSSIFEISGDYDSGKRQFTASIPWHYCTASTLPYNECWGVYATMPFSGTWTGSSAESNWLITLLSNCQVTFATHTPYYNTATASYANGGTISTNAYLKKTSDSKLSLEATIVSQRLFTDETLMLVVARFHMYGNIIVP